MARAVYNQMLTLAQQRKSACCDLSTKSFDHFWQEMHRTLLSPTDDVEKRIGAWEKLIKYDFGANLNYFPSSPKSGDPWVRDFRAIAAKVPLWENPTAPPLGLLVLQH